MKKRINAAQQDILPRALALQSQGDHEGAKLLFHESLSKKNNQSYIAYYSLAAIESNDGHYEKALNYAEKAVSANKSFPNSYLALSIILFKLGRFEEALAKVSDAVRIKPDYSEAIQHMSVVQRAIQSRQSATIPPAPIDHPGTDNIAVVMQLAEAQVAAGQTEKALQIYQNYLKNEQAVAHPAFFNMGVILCAENRHAEAEAYFRHCIHLAPTFFMAYLNLGMVLENRGHKESAIAIWEEALQHPECSEKNLRISLLNNAGRLNEMERQFSKAEHWLHESLSLDNLQSPVLQHWFHLRQKQCNWPVYLDHQLVDETTLMRNVSPLAMLAASDDPALQLAAAQRFVEEKVGKYSRLVSRSHRYHHKRIRIAFLSSDLSMHAVSLLTVELFETLDRHDFEVYAYCWSKEDGTPFRQRVINAFDHFNKVGHLDDETVARQIVADEIDVVVDLQGITSGARPNIVAQGPAPIQITWLGFPGPTALPHIDYVIADQYLFPDVLKPYFTEAPLYVETLFQVSDSQRVINPTPSRSSLGLPERQFVYCAFNNNYKISPEMFECWMRILRSVPESVLWMLGDNEWSRANFHKSAMAHGIHPDRLIFAERCLPADYLGRFGAADLFLDTCPYNAGTTANDALWSGLPLLTLSGKTYVSRMAGSLLCSLKLEKMACATMDEYERKAISLGLNPEMCLKIREHLQEVKSSGQMFSTLRFTREFRSALQKILDDQEN